MVVESKIEGECKGWDGNTVFKFSNGQIWRQSVYRYKYFYKYYPTVRIWRDGSRYLLEIDGVQEKLSVTKLQ